MNETPEAVRERIRGEELARGADPRVAEARSKAAEARAKHGLPIDPQEAWPIKLEREGGGAAPSTVAEAQPAGSEAQAAAPAAEEPATETADAAAADVPAPAAAEAPATEPVAAAATSAAAPAAVPAGPPAYVTSAAPALPTADFDPEVGEVVELDETVLEVGGVRVREAALPKTLVLVLLMISVWAIIYMTATGAASVQTETGCQIHANLTFSCFSSEPASE